MRKLFGTSGIRGYTLTQITPSLAEKTARAYGMFLGGKGKLAVGRDTRYGAETIAHAIIAGATGSGLDVVDCGMVSTPALAAYLTKLEEVSGAIMVTGSHTSPDRIGLILLESDGTYLYGESVMFIENTVPQLNEIDGYVKDLKTVGSVNIVSDVISYYERFLLSLVNIPQIRKGKFKVLVDPVNGTSCHYLPHILSVCGCEVFLINEIPMGIPARHSEPREDTLQDTMAEVERLGVDFGIALDVDADRIMFITREADIAKVVLPDVLGVILMEEVLKKNKGPVVLPINTSGLAELVLKKYGISPIHCRIGQPSTLAAVKSSGAVFAYEESGKYFFTGDKILWSDGALTALRIMEKMTADGVKLHTLASKYPKFFTKTLSLTVPQRLAGLVMEETMKKWKKKVSEDEIISETNLDGFRRTYKDGSWLLLRRSGTEPLIRVTTDSTTKERAQELINFGVELVTEAIEKFQEK